MEFVNETDLRNALVAISNNEKDVARAQSHVPFELLDGIDDGQVISREGAVAMARVYLSDTSDRSAMRKAEAALRAATVTADPEAIRGAIEFERGSARGTARMFELASQRFALAIGRDENGKRAKKYNTVGAGRSLSADDIKPGGYLAQGDVEYVDLPRFSEGEFAVKVWVDELLSNEGKAERWAMSEQEAHERAVAYALGIEEDN